MDDVSVRMHNEIGAMEQRSKEFKKMVDKLVGFVDEMQERVRLSHIQEVCVCIPKVL